MSLRCKPFVARIAFAMVSRAAGAPANHPTFRNRHFLIGNKPASGFKAAVLTPFD